MSEFRAILRPKPGSIMPDGSIIAIHGTLERIRMQHGAIFIERRRLEVARRFGWELTQEHQPLANLVCVVR